MRKSSVAKRPPSIAQKPSMRAPSTASQVRAPSTAKLPEPAPAGDDDIPDFLRGVIDAGPSAQPAPTQAAKPAPAKLPEPAADADDDIPDFLKGALGSGAGT